MNQADVDLDIREDELRPLKQSANAMQGSDLLNYLNNDEGNCQRILAVSGEDIRYCHDFRKFLVWDGRRWAIDRTERVKRMAKLAIFEYLKQAIERKDDKAEKFAKDSLNDSRIKAALAMIQSEIPITPGELDQHHYLLNFKNGTVDLRTGEIGSHSRDHYITKLVHFDYRPEVSTPLFLPFLKRIMGYGDMDESQIKAAHLMDFIQKAIGYSLTGVTSEKAVFVLWGGGDNGKTTLLELFRYLLSEYAVLLQIDTLMTKSQETNNTQSDLADLRGARFAMTSETEKGQRLAEGKLKRITQGMGKVKAVRKYENPIEFDETHKLWMDANHKPVIRGTDNAIWNALNLIPFTVTIPKPEQDPRLVDKLQAEAEGILAWAVYGARRWFEFGLGKPEEVKKAVSGWRDESDPLKDFFAECDVQDHAECKVTELRKAYTTWCESNGERRPLERKEFNERMEDKGFHQKHRKDGSYWIGLGLQGGDP